LSILSAYREKVATVLPISTEIVISGVGFCRNTSWNLLADLCRLIGYREAAALRSRSIGIGGLWNWRSRSLSTSKKVAQRTLSSAAAHSTSHYLDPTII
jgi:hypothetical protein